MSPVLPFGSWPSPLDAGEVSVASSRLEGARFVGDEIWWGETVPQQGGRSTVRRDTAHGEVADVLPAPWSARSRVHEYGGGAWTATADGDLVFVERSDQRVWKLRPGDEPQPLTGDAAGVRYGGLTVSAGRLLAVREVHAPPSAPRRDIVEIPLDASGVRSAAAVVSIAAGSDFVAQPALSPGGSHLAWIAWDHPDMPWDATQLRVADVRAGRATDVRIVAGGPGRAPLQPLWTGGDELTFLDDPTGRWNLWRRRGEAAPVAVAPADADTGGALWSLGARWYQPLEDGRIVAVQTDGADRIVVVDPGTGATTTLPLPIVTDATVHDARGTRVLVTGTAPAVPGGLWVVDVDDPAGTRLVRGPATPGGDAWSPAAQALTVDGPRGPVHAFLYPPTNPEVTGPPGELPPALVLAHGGPTAGVGPAASTRIGYFTSRGIAVLDVNYSGSTGYGRAYRERLRGQWGVADVEDVAAVATEAAARGLVDGSRIAIAGGSAGGWTVLGAVTRTSVFAAGISRYGVADARLLAADTHDFEARYLDGLIGELPAAESLYVTRSPLSHLDRLRTPLLIEQGLDDDVVPPAQSQALRDALAARGVAHAYLAFEGEGHGFRRADTIARTLRAELSFLGQVLGFDTPGVPRLALEEGQPRSV